MINEQDDVVRKMKDFEQEHGLVLPDQYKQAIARCKLDQYRHWRFEFIGADGFANDTNVDTFYSFRTDDKESVPSNYQFYVTSGRVPKHAIPIAQCIAGNLICIDLRDDRYGAICYWDHEFELAFDPADVLATIAPNLKNFLSLLKKDE